ncbi:uncharacterized protein LOC141661912 [Apium graveolens]|uniref:uncharacterized protein LOC141661912 n=1 Tax=Apium graveolens TaxID=4045 RepID=UPI003D79F842
MFGEDGISYIEENLLWVVPLNRAHSQTLNLATEIGLLKELLKNLKAESASSGEKEACPTIQVDVNPVVLLDRQGASIYQSKCSPGWNCLFPSIIITIIGFGLYILFVTVLFPFYDHPISDGCRVFERSGMWYLEVLYSEISLCIFFMYSGLSVLPTVMRYI